MLARQIRLYYSVFSLRVIGHFTIPIVRIHKKDNCFPMFYSIARLEFWFSGPMWADRLFSLWYSPIKWPNGLQTFLLPPGGIRIFVLRKNFLGPEVSSLSQKSKLNTNSYKDFIYSNPKSAFHVSEMSSSLGKHIFWCLADVAFLYSGVVDAEIQAEIVWKLMCISHVSDIAHNYDTSKTILVPLTTFVSREIRKFPIF